MDIEFIGMVSMIPLGVILGLTLYLLDSKPKGE